ncbi:hypothetical protein L2744_17510 [Shewanella profunda]|uniref:hypothetical protein n=1 Tax=Shewanella profunda TaxID=254793 RepID=UPI00200F2AFF|nr:hypothetical protein [Shewanella profunda]MCL1091367.1 hypothetical protein [Shewanella profunda]
MDIEFFPQEGWDKFEQHEELIKSIFSSLTLKEQGGVWQYLNFTSFSSIWENEQSAVILEFADEEGTLIERVVLKNPSESSELQIFMHTLKESFHLECKDC